ncbi:MAG: YkgJ family cysteine cluster protein [Planctomycetota bacterium]
MDASEGFPFRWTCKRSGNCCAIPGGFVRVNDDEAAAIAAHLGLSVTAFRARYVQPDGERLKDGLGNRCVFLRDGAEAACTIYPVRPGKCRSFPYWPELKSDPRLLALVQRTCPGIEPRGDGGPGA